MTTLQQQAADAQQAAAAAQQRAAAAGLSAEAAEAARRDAEDARLEGRGPRRAGHGRPGRGRPDDGRGGRRRRPPREAERAAPAAERQLTRERDDLAAQLDHALSSVAQITKTARGVVVNLPDILFDINKATLKPNTQIALAKLAGIVQLFPKINLRIEGYTDSTGSDALNMRLSNERAESVRSFLREAGRRREPHDGRRLRAEVPGRRQRDPRGPFEEPAGRDRARRGDGPGRGTVAEMRRCRDARTRGRARRSLPPATDPAESSPSRSRPSWGRSAPG